MRSTVASMPLTFKQRRLLAAVLVVVLSAGLLVMLPAGPAHAATCPCTIWTTQTPTTAADPDTAAVEVGVKFRADTDGSITGIRFYKGAGNTGTHVGNLWSSTGTQLATVAFSGESATGWQQALFATPVNIAAGTTYVASYYAPNGHYAADDGYFGGNAVVNAPLTALADGTDGGNGVYRYGMGGGFPNSSYQATNYWVDVVYNTTAPDTTKPTVTDRQPAAGATGVSLSSVVSATFSESVQQGTIALTVKAGSTTVNGALAYSAATRTATFTPSANLTGNTLYTVNLSGTLDTAGNQMDAVSWTFTTGTAAGGCPCTIWGNTVPATPAANDNSAVELGVKFRTSQAGYITGLRFYKGSGNSGTHVGTLWSGTGTKLASVTFTGESTTGWQQATLAAPVAVSANTTYVASYYAPVGRYAALSNAFASSATTNGPLTALRNGTDGGNGVYKYGATGFPTSTYQSSNYFVDVVFAVTAVDTTPPGVTAQVPAPGSAGVAVSTPVSATFSEAVTSSTISMTLKNAANATVAGTVGYDNASLTATFTPSGALAYSTSYTATVSGAKDAAGNTMTTVSWSFTTGAPPPPPPDQGPGGPIAIVTSSANPYSKYLAEILRTEGLNEFTTVDLGSLTASTLAPYDVVVLGAVTPSADQVTALTNWVTSGGNLIALKPTSSLAGLLGITAASGQVTDGYLRVDTRTSPGAGIIDQTIQYHGPADQYTLASGTQAVATLYSNATTATVNPAVTLRTVGTSGGQAAAFTFDLTRSIVLTRQGNPAWAGQERDAQTPIRSDDMYFGGSTTDWVNLDKVAIPQADEQQRLLANLVQTMNRDRKPLPRFWYFPNGNKAVVIATGDDHGNGGTAGRFDQYLSNSPANCSVTNWTCPRFSSYVYPSTPLTNAQATTYTGQGFEVGIHVQNGCSDYTPTSLASSYSSDLASWKARFTSQPPPSSNRYHCIVYSDWASQPKTELANGMRLDGNYYFWPGSWVQNRSGFMTGSGMPMRFADTDGTMIDVYQAPSQMTDESDQVFPFTPDTLLNNALGDPGYYGAFNANMHTDSATTFQSDQLLASALAHNVPLVSGRQMITWLDGRNASSFGSVTWTGNTLTFSVSVGTGANGLTAMLPTAGPGGTVLSTLTRAGAAVSFTTSTVKGLEYASFAAAGGGYTATYAVPAGSGGSGLRGTVSLAQIAAAPALEIGKVGVNPALAVSGAAAAVTWVTNRPSTSQVAYGTSPDALTSTQALGETTRLHRVVLAGLTRGTTYYYRVTSTDTTGVQQTSPAPGVAAGSFATPTADRNAPAASNPVVTALPDGTARVSWTTDRPTRAGLRFGSVVSKLVRRDVDQTLESTHQTVLTGLQPNSTYWVSTSSTDEAGNSVDGPTVPVVTPGPGVAEQGWTAFKRGTTAGQATIDTTELGGVTLSGLDGQRRTGTFTSGILDAQAMVDWDRASIHADIPDGARVTVRVRTGSTATPDGTWSAWKVVGDGDRVGTGSRFIQYEVTLVARVNGSAPTLQSIAFGNNAVAVPAPKESN